MKRMVLTVWLCACVVSASAQATKKTHVRLDVKTASKLVTHWEKNRHLHDGSLGKTNLPMVEITPPDAWERLGGQVFKVVQGDLCMDETYFVKDCK